MRVNKKYNFERLIERSNIEDISFIITLDKKPVIGLLGFTCIEKGIIDVPSILIEDKKMITDKVEKYFFQTFDKMIIGKRFSFWFRDFVDNGELSNFSKKLLRDGGTAKLKFSQILNLKLDLNLLRTKIRKRYKSFINNGFKKMDIQVFDSKNINKEIILDFRDLHITEAGRETKSRESWLNKYEIIKGNEGFLVTGKINGKLCSAGLFSTSYNYADYQVSASSFSNSGFPLFHSLMWKAICHSKEIGCSFFEIGEIVFKNHPSDIIPSEKSLVFLYLNLALEVQPKC